MAHEHAASENDPLAQMNPVQRLGFLVQKNYGTFRGWVRSLLGQLEFILGRLDRFLRPDLVNTRRLIFVCLGNINRSAFADWVAQKHGATVASIGLSTSTGAPAFHMAVDTANQFSVDLSHHLATDITDYEFQVGDLLLVMEIRHAKKLVELGIPAEAITLLGNWAYPHRIHLHDPHTLSKAYFQTCFSLIHSAVGNLLSEIRSSENQSVWR